MYLTSMSHAFDLHLLLHATFCVELSVSLPRHRAQVLSLFVLRLVRPSCVLIVLGPRPDDMPVQVEDHWYWNHSDGYKAQDAGRPVDANAVVHVRCEEWEAGTEEATHEGVAADGAVGHAEVDVDDVVDALDEDHV